MLPGRALYAVMTGATVLKAKPSAMPGDVTAAFDAVPGPARAILLRARKLVFAEAQSADVGPLTETLKWGQPSYLTQASKNGSTIRLGLHKGQPAAFFNCQTTLVDGFRADFPEVFEYVGNRAVLLDDEESDPQALGFCLSRALTYHRDKRRRL